MEKKKLRNSALVFCIILLIWPVFVSMSIPQGSLGEQIRAVQDSLFLHILNFLVALSIAPSMLIMLKRIYPFLKTTPGSPIIRLIIFFYAVYFLLISISYGSQVFYLPFILDAYPGFVVEKWFFYNNNSLPISVNQTGYLGWSIATLLYLIPPLGKQRGILFYAMIIFILSSILQIIASLGFYARIPEVSGLTFYSGLLMFPAGVLVFLFARLSKKQ